VANDNISTIDESICHQVEHQECADGNYINNYVEFGKECN
jgi:hypothetical protein